jgi:ATPase subunit of ABC transporter with duplicated ATPase domains
VGYIDVSDVSFSLSDGRVLLDEVSFRVGEGATAALIGANGAGKSTLMRLIRGEISPDSGTVSVDGGLGVMDQFVGHVRDDSTVRDLLISVAPAAVRAAALAVDRAELAQKPPAR